MEVVGSVTIPAVALDAEISGSYAYLASGEKGLLIADIRDPAMPKIVTAVDTPGSATAVAVAGDIAYVADAECGLQVVDVSDPAAASIVASVADSGMLMEIAVAGSCVYAGNNSGELHIIDVSSPLVPKPAGCFKVANGKWVFGVAVELPYAYVTCGNPTQAPKSSEFAVVDVSDPSSPRGVSSIKTRRVGNNMELSGGYAYIASGGFKQGGFEIVDISDPMSPKSAGYVDCPFVAGEVVLKGKYALLSCRGVLVVDISDPFSPYIIDLIEVQGHASDVALGGPFFLVAAIEEWTKDEKKGNIQLLAESATARLPASPVFAAPDPRSSASPMVRYLPTSSTYSPVAVSDNIVCTTQSGTNGKILQVLDLSTSSLPAVPVTIELPGEAKDIVIWKNRVVAAADQLYVIDISRPGQPVVMHAVEGIEGTYAIEISGSYAYVVNGVGLRIFRLGIRGGMKLVGSVDTPYSARDVAVAGKYAYIADGAGLQIVDVSNKRKPKLAGSFIYGWAMATRVAAEGRRAYLADKSGFITVIDASDVSEPIPVGKRLLAGPIGAMAIADSRLYAPVCAESAVLEILDIAVEGSPAIAKLVKSSRNSYGGAVAVSGSRIFVNDAAEGLLSASLPEPSQKPAHIEINPSQLLLSCEQGVTADVEFELGNSGDRPLSYFVSSNVEWLQLSPFAGGIQEKEAAPITVSLLPYTLSEGRHNVKLTIADPAADNSPSTVEVVVDIKPPTYQAIEAQPKTLSLKDARAGTVGTVVLTSKGPFKVLDASASFKWIKVEKDSEKEDFEHAITVKITETRNGRYGDAIKIFTDNPGYKRIAVPLSLSFAED